MTAYSNKDLMKLAIEEHLKCSEYPRVGAVISKDGRILSTGYRGEKPNIHAERIAIEKLTTEELKGSKLYTTLEPCINIDDEQTQESCASLIINSGISDVVIGVLDPNGTIYSQGYSTLLENDINVSFFNRSLRKAIEEETFEFGNVEEIVSHGKRRVPVVNSGIDINIKFSKTDDRTIKFKWASLQTNHNCVDLQSSNGAVRMASGAKNFEDITDPMIFRFPSHFARMRPNQIAIIKPKNKNFCVLIKLLKIYDNDILFQWEVRNEKS